MKNPNPTNDQTNNLRLLHFPHVMFLIIFIDAIALNGLNSVNSMDFNVFYVFSISIAHNLCILSTFLTFIDYLECLNFILQSYETNTLISYRWLSRCKHMIHAPLFWCAPKRNQNLQAKRDVPRRKHLVK